MGTKFSKGIKKIKNYPVVIIGSFVFVLVFGFIGYVNEFADFLSNIDKFSGTTPNKFDKNEKNELNILIFPFNNYSGTTGSNLSFRIFEVITEIKNQENLENLNIEFYKESILHMNNEQLQEIGEELKADFIVSGSYELSANCEASICIYDFSFINVMKNNKITDKTKFNSILANETEIVKPLEFYVYYYLGLIELYNGGDPNKAIHLLEKAKILTENNFLKAIISMYSIALKFPQHKNRELLNLTPEEAGLDLTRNTYGLCSQSPIFVNGFLNAKFYLNSLKFEGEYIHWEQYGTKTANLSPKNQNAEINIAKIYSKSGNYLGLIYLFLESSESFFFPPKGYVFEPLYKDPKEIMLESMNMKDSLTSFPSIDFEIISR